MAYRFLRLFALLAILALIAAGAASAQDCSGTITADEAIKAENARYAAQTTNDFAAMEKLFGNDLTYNHSSAATDDKAKYIDGMRSGRTKYRTMTPNSDVKAPALAQWHTVRVVAVGDRIQAWLDGALHLDHRDSRFKSGRVGLWTKADSITAFDDLLVRGKTLLDPETGHAVQNRG